VKKQPKTGPLVEAENEPFNDDEIQIQKHIQNHETQEHPTLFSDLHLDL
jgi:hypothetical protein